MKKNDRDAVQKRYWADRIRTTEILNHVLFDGKDVLTPEEVRDAVMEASVQLASSGGGTKGYKRATDGAKLVTVGQDSLYVYLENQSYVDYAMPERNLALEAACYHEQRSGMRREHRRTKDLKRGAEYVSGFAKKDRFIPALCIVLYYGEDPWDAEKTLGKILQVPQACPKLKKLLNDNHIVLLDVKRFTHPEKLRTDLRETFSIIKYSSDKEKLNAYIKAHREELKELPEDAFDFIAYTTESMKLMKLKNDSKTEKGGYDVCKAIQDMMDDSQKRGEKIGIKIGKEIGKERGKKEGEKTGRSTTIIQYIKASFAEGRLADQIVESLIRYFALSKRQANAYMRQYTQSQQ